MATPRENSVTQLTELYNVVIGIALSIAIYNTIDQQASTIPILWNVFPNFLTFLVIIIPFYHGAVRHLFATYVEDGGSTRIRNEALLLDFVLLFVEGCLFVAMSVLIAQTFQFTLVLVAVLAFDTIWGWLAYLAFTGAQAQRTERTWAWINFLTSILIFFWTLIGPGILGGWNLTMQCTILLACLVRTVVDYRQCWGFYFPAAHR